MKTTTVILLSFILAVTTVNAQETTLNDLQLLDRIAKREKKEGKPIPINKETVDKIHKKTVDKIDEIIKRADRYDVIVFDPEEEHTFSKSLVIDKPLTIRGLRAKQKKPKDFDDPKDDRKFSLLSVESDDVFIEDFKLEGYYYKDKIKNKYYKDRVDKKKNPYEKNREPLIRIKKSNFIVHHGEVSSSLKDGIMISPDEEDESASDIDGGLIVDITGKDNHKDVVSIGGKGAHRVRNVYVREITCADSVDKGAVEVSDGTDNISVYDITAKRSVYAVDVQDHKKEQETNRDITIEKVTAIDCEHAVRTKNRDLGHADLTINDVTARRCSIPIQVSNTTNVTIEDVCIKDGKPGKGAPYELNKKNKNDIPRIELENCSKITLADIRIQDDDKVYTRRIEFENCSDITLDGEVYSGDQSVKVERTKCD